VEFNIIETTLTDSSKVYALQFAGVHQSGAVLNIVIDCVSEAAAKSLRDNIDATYTSVWINDRE
jgi:hypothetical protein